ncbi:MAG TPA: type 1 glutamine amidotransferase [Opitutaceae bacterium]|nr:type 1 glutamine amidotransferase [Opitutaceae bacterium]
MLKRVLAFQHAAPEHPGLIATALRAKNIAITCLRPDRGEPLPASLGEFDGLVVMGGPQSVYEEDRYPYLRAEKTLVREAITTSRPVLGVCLGSQIVAEVLGAHVWSSGQIEFGWRPVALSAESAEDPVLQHLPRVVVPLHWHGDVYNLPLGATPVGSSAQTPVQGFVWNRRCYAILFHLEITPEQLTEMARTFPDDVSRAGTTVEALLAETMARAAALREPALRAFSAWADLL